MIRQCQGCNNTFETKFNSLYCPCCKENGVTFNCVVCGKPVHIKWDTHRKYLKNPNHIWQCSTCGATTPDALEKRVKSLKENYANRTDEQREADSKRKSIGSKKAWDNKTEAEKQATVQRLAEGRMRPDVVAKHKAATTSDEFREMKREHTSARYKNPEEVEKQRVIGRELWERPEFRKKMEDAWAEGSPLRENAALARRQAYADKELTEEEYAKIDVVLKSYPSKARFINTLATFGAYEVVSGIRLYSREKSMWDSIIADIIACHGECRRSDLVALTGYSPTSFNRICRELNLQGITDDYRGLQNDVQNFVSSLYKGTILVEQRPEFMRNKAGHLQELDLYLPDMSLAIEVNGTTWHSEQGGKDGGGKDKNYHYDKSRLCREVGVRLIHVWQHEWNNERQRPILESIIKSALGITERVYARKLVIEYRPSASMREFFDTNNIQGFRGGEFAACLVDPKTSEVIMAYLIGKGSHMSKGHAYEVVRGASKLGYTVVGGSSKLLSAIFNDKQLDDIVYYIDYNYFDGRSLKDDTRWKFISEQVSFKNYDQKTGKVLNRNPSKHREITEKYKTGEMLKLWNAGTATYVYKKND